MTTLLALTVVGVGSVLYRVLPLLGAARIPGTAARVAGWAGLAVLSAITVRSVLQHEDAAVPWAVPVAVVSVGVGLALAVLGRHMLVVLAAGAGTYLVLGWGLHGLA
jgi:branched-subunit amino acid transport protein